MARTTRSVAALAGAVLALGMLSPAQAAKPQSASGAASLDGNARHMSFNAKQHADGTVTGQAQLVNRNFTGADGTSPYRAHFEISCMKVVGNIAILGGFVTSTNDPNLVDAAFFTVQDNGEPGRNDKISRVFFWDDDPTTTGDPQACLVTGPNDFPLETIENGNIQVK